MTDTPFSPSQIAVLEGLFLRFKMEIKIEFHEEMQEMRADFRKELQEAVRPLAKQAEVLELMNTMMEVQDLLRNRFEEDQNAKQDALRKDHEKLSTRVVRCEKALGFI